MGKRRQAEPAPAPTEPAPAAAPAPSYALQWKNPAHWEEPDWHDENRQPLDTLEDALTLAGELTTPDRAYRVVQVWTVPVPERPPIPPDGRIQYADPPRCLVHGGPMRWHAGAGHWECPACVATIEAGVPRRR